MIIRSWIWMRMGRWRWRSSCRLAPRTRQSGDNFDRRLAHLLLLLLDLTIYDAKPLPGNRWQPGICRRRRRQFAWVAINLNLGSVLPQLSWNKFLQSNECNLKFAFEEWKELMSKSKSQMLEICQSCHNKPQRWLNTDTTVVELLLPPWLIQVLLRNKFLQFKSYNQR